MKNLIGFFVADEVASVNVEYSMIALLIGISAIGAITSLSGNVTINYNTISTAMTGGDSTGTIK